MEHLNDGTVTREMVEAVAHELRRAHQFWSDEFHAAWSHGDAGTNNVIHDEETDRARVIDFEILHENHCPRNRGTQTTYSFSYWIHLR